ncbi:hypothetical protein JQ604_34640 [Bradyrhizobium jicamae]|uniref:hypothetical protein n=1 Tax=Bradyrhizobium jicamae TaxID=280332 RepID=UPI001BAB5BE4|nr:hypothetical protein [Bradyrhizobium jicamae]MBR0757347.1 hypothetical protein [Bradyrhizobium jicamae]
MSNRSAKFVSALVATILAGANFTAVAQNTTNAKPTDTKTADTKTADSCLSGPKGSAPAGSHWRYRVERDTKRKCWYLGDEKKTAKATPAKQDAAAPDTVATAADAAPAQAAPPQPAPAPAAPAMRQSVANARAELTQGAPIGTVNVAQADPSAAPANAPASDVSARWLDAQSMGSTNGTRYAATQPAGAAPAEAAPAPEPAAAPAAPAPASVATERPSGSTQMLLIVMVGALALAGLVGALVFKLTRTRTPPYQIHDEWRAPWDSIHTERAPTLMPREAMQMRLSEAPPRRAEPPIARQRLTREPEPDNAEATQQINAMLQRLARSAAT